MLLRFHFERIFQFPAWYRRIRVCQAIHLSDQHLPMNSELDEVIVWKFTSLIQVFRCSLYLNGAGGPSAGYEIGHTALRKSPIVVNMPSADKDSGLNRWSQRLKIVA